MSLRQINVTVVIATAFKKETGLWRRSAYRKILGINTAHLFKEYKMEFVETSVQDRSKKMSALFMIEEIRRKLPNSYDIKSEQLL